MKKSIALLVALTMLAASALTLTGCTSSGSNGVKVVNIPLTQEEYAFGVDKSQPELLTKVNEFIAKIKSDGTFDKICNNYFGDGTPVAVNSAAPDESKDQLVVSLPMQASNPLNTPKATSITA